MDLILVFLSLMLIIVVYFMTKSNFKRFVNRFTQFSSTKPPPPKLHLPEKRYRKKKAPEDEGYDDPTDKFDPQYDEKENNKFIEMMKRNHGERFEDFKQFWRCKKCEKDITRHEEHYNCVECDDRLCFSCFHKHENSQEEPLHRHGYGGEEISFFSKVDKPRWTLKMELYRNVNTCSQLLMSCLKAFSDRPFLGTFSSDRSKIQFITFGEVLKRTQFLANGLRELNVWPKHFAGILGEPSVDWVVSDFACLHQSITSVPIQRSLPVDEIEYIVRHCELRVLFVSSSYFDKVIMSIVPKCPNLKLVVVLNETKESRKKIEEEYSTSLRHLHCKVMHIAEVIAKGSMSKEYIRRKAKSADVMTVIFTSGSTGRPKGAVFTEKDWVSQMKFPLTLKNVVLYAYLPMSHIAGRCDIFTALYNGGKLIMPSDSERLNNFFSDLQMVRPTAFGPVPRIVNKVYSQWQCDVQEEIRCGRAKEAKVRVQKKFKDVFGDRLSSVKVSSAPISVKVKRWLRNTIQMSVTEGYGSTEAGSISSNNVITNEVKLISVPELGYLVENGQGEICVKRVRMSGYFKNEEEMEKRFDPDGWFRTGDIGERMENNRIRVIDRVSNVIKLSNGEFISLEKLENVYEKCECVKEVFIYADSFKEFCVAIVVPNNIHVSRREIERQLEEEREKNGLRDYERIAAVHVDVKMKEWTSASGLLTESKKKIRRNLQRHYQQNINDLYLRFSLEGVLGQGVNTGTDSFRDMGGDSLKAVAVINELKKKSIHIDFEQLMNPNTSLNDLQVQNRVVETNKIDPNNVVGYRSELERAQKMYENHFRKKKEYEQKKEDKGIFITGGSGFLGMAIVRELLSKSKKKLYCLVRSSSKEKFFECFESQKRVILITGDLCKPYFGLKECEFLDLQNRIDVIIHAGCQVNHLLPFDSLYASNVESLFTILALSLSKNHLPLPIHYISSISVYKKVHRVCKGYGSSKFVCDSVLVNLKQQYPDVSLLIYRPALIVGHSEVNRKDWLMKLLHACIECECVPNVEDEVPLNVVPVDYCSAIIGELVLLRNGSSQKVAKDVIYNMCAKNVSFKQIFQWMNELLACEVLAHGKWFRRIKVFVEEKNHAFKPFVNGFAQGVNSMFVDYDMYNVQRDVKGVEFEKMKKEELHRSLKLLKKFGIY